MGRGRILNKVYVYAQGVQDIHTPPEVERGTPSFPKMYRTHNVAYPDILYEKVQKQIQPDNVFVSRPMPPADETMLTYAEPSNIVTDEILYEDRTPDFEEDYRITGVVPTRMVPSMPGGIDAGGRNTVVTTEYNTGINEKVRRDNPAVVIEETTPLTGKRFNKIARLKPLQKPVNRRFNIDYAKDGTPLQKEPPVYDTMDWVKDLRLTRAQDLAYGENIGRVSNDTVDVWEEFLTKGRIRQGYEILSSEDF